MIPAERLQSRRRSKTLNFVGWDWTMFIWGLLGAISVEAIRLKKLHHRGLQVEASWYYLVVNGGTVLLAAVITAGALLPPNPFAAVYSAATWPIMISAFAGEWIKEDAETGNDR